MSSSFFRVACRLLALAACSALLASPAAAVDDCLYAITADWPWRGAPVVLYDVDPATGQASNPRTTGMDSAIGLALGSNNFLYAVNNENSPQIPALFRINRKTGVATRIGSLGLSSLVFEGDLAFHPDGTLYGIGYSELFTIDTTTGAATPVGPVGIFGADYSYLAFNLNGILYTLDNGYLSISYFINWLRVDPSTGAVTVSLNKPYYLGPAGGMDWDSVSGQFLLIDSKPLSAMPATFGSNSLYRIDRYGNRTLVGPLGVAGAFGGLASCTGVTQPDLAGPRLRFDSPCRPVVVVDNPGPRPSPGPFTVNISSLRVPDGGDEPQTVFSAAFDGLAAGETASVALGPIEAFGPTVTLRVDPENVIVEGDESNNVVTVAVPPECVAEPASCVATPAGTVGWYPFDEAGGTGVADVAGMRFGVKAGGPAAATGRVAGALELDGVDDSVRVPYAAELDFDGPGAGGAITFDAWIRTGGDESGTVVSKLAGGAGPGLLRGYELGVEGGRLSFALHTDTATPSTQEVAAAGVIQSGTWHHVAVTLDRAASPSIVLYVDGQPVASGDADPQIETDAVESLVIGGRVDPDSGQLEALFDGRIDELAVTGRALAADEIDGLWTAGRYGRCKEPRPAFVALADGFDPGQPDPGLESADVLTTFHRLQDERLPATRSGLYFVSFFQEHRGRIAYLLQHSAELRQAAQRVLYAYAPGLEAELAGDGSAVPLSADMAADLMQLADLLIATDLAHGGGALAAAVDGEVQRIDWPGLVGMTFDELLLYIERLPVD